MIIGSVVSEELQWQDDFETDGRTDGRTDNGVTALLDLLSPSAMQVKTVLIFKDKKETEEQTNHSKIQTNFSDLNNQWSSFYKQAGILTT